MAAAPEPSMQLLAEVAQNQSPLPNHDLEPVIDHDDGSSSLSDPDDRLAAEVTDPVLEKSSQLSDEEEDTEAETERLEESPDKLRQQKKVLLTVPEAVSNGISTPTIRTEIVTLNGNLPEEQEMEVAEEIHSDIIDQTSPISSLDESVDEGSILGSQSSSSSRKRKREEDDSTDRTIKKAAMQMFANQLGDHAVDEVNSSTRFLISSADGPPKALSNKPFERDGETPPEEHPDIENQDDVEETLEGVESNEEDVDMDDGGPELEANTRNVEEIAKKKTALERLGKIEQDFALLRDKLFADKTRQLNEELSSLEAENITHPDYLAMVSAIGRQRQERQNAARTRFKYQVQNLQARCRADRVVILSQYCQTARDIRDTSFSQANQEWYQIRRGRGTIEETAESFALSSVKRSDLVANQNSYNTEVSILAGFAKYVGFPAAPEVTGTSQTEMEQDMRNMGISLQPQQPQQPPVSSSISSQFLRQNLAAEKQFSRVTPWANAQHPQHTHSINATPWSNARPNSPFTTPAGPSRAGDTPQVVGSGSTIPVSQGPTPSGSEVIASNPKQHSKISDLFAETPSRLPSQVDHSSIDASGLGTRSTEGVSNRNIPSGKGRQANTGNDVTSPILKLGDRQPPAHIESPGMPSTSEGRLTSGFASHNKLPTELRVGMA